VCISHIATSSDIARPWIAFYIPCSEEQEGSTNAAGDGFNKLNCNLLAVPRVAKHDAGVDGEKDCSSNMWLMMQSAKANKKDRYSYVWS
jgi:hypothetical protein